MSLVFAAKKGLRNLHYDVSTKEGRLGILRHKYITFKSQDSGFQFSLKFYTPASKASREATNLTERKNPNTPLNDVKDFVRLSVCLCVCYKL